MTVNEMSTLESDATKKNSLIYLSIKSYRFIVRNERNNQIKKKTIKTYKLNFIKFSCFDWKKNKTNGIKRKIHKILLRNT